MRRTNRLGALPSCLTLSFAFQRSVHNGKLVAMTDREQAHRDRLTTDAGRALLGLVSLAGGRAGAPEAVSKADLKRQGAAVGRTLLAIAEVAADDAMRDARQRGKDCLDAKADATVHAMEIIDGLVGRTLPAAMDMVDASCNEVRRNLEAVN